LIDQRFKNSKTVKFFAKGEVLQRGEEYSKAFYVKKNFSKAIQLIKSGKNIVICSLLKGGSLQI